MQKTKSIQQPTSSYTTYTPTLLPLHQLFLPCSLCSGYWSFLFPRKCQDNTFVLRLDKWYEDRQTDYCESFAKWTEVQKIFSCEGTLENFLKTSNALKFDKHPGLMAHTCCSSTRKAEAETWVRGLPGLQSKKCFRNSLVNRKCLLIKEFYH